MRSATRYIMTQPSEALVAVAVLQISTGGAAEVALDTASSVALKKAFIDRIHI